MTTHGDALEAVVLRRLRSPQREEALQALDEVFRRHGAAVFAFSARRLQRPALAESVVEDVFAELFLQRRTLALGEDSLRSYLVKRTYRRCTELHAALLDAAPGVGRLSADQRLAVDLASLGHMNCAQVGQLLGVSEEGVKSLVSRALQRATRVALE